MTAFSFLCIAPLSALQSASWPLFLLLRLVRLAGDLLTPPTHPTPDKEGKRASSEETFLEFRDEIERLREDLVKKVNDIPTTPYLESKRFLQELYEATRALEQGEAVNQRAFQRWLEEGKGGRSVQDLVDFMGKNALQFAPAASADEASYRAAYQALANYDLAMNQQHAAEQ